tara:strand:- start:477 stop:1133 length:657 start_codon:yes stop_codon:yes gene_type:complete
MSKILALAFMLSPLAAQSADLGKIDISTKISHKDGIHVGLSDGGTYNFGIAGEGYTFSFDGADNDMELGVSGVYLSHSDSKNAGIGYGAGIGIFDGGVHYNWMTNGDHVVGGATTITIVGVSLETSVNWNVSSQNIGGKAGTSMDLWGAQASAISKWDVDSFSFDGIDLSAGYTIPISEGLSITPVASMGLDEDWGRGDIKVAVGISMSFGSNGIPAS